MNIYYRVKIGFFNELKTKKLKRRLGIESVIAILKLWGYAAEFRPDGNLSGMTDEDIELSVGWDDARPLMPTLAALGFVDGSNGEYRLHDWAEQQPEAMRRHRYLASGGYDENGNRLFPEDWQATKASVYRRDGRICQYCGTSDGPFHIDHVIPRIKGGPDSIENLVVACASCNTKKGSKSVSEWLGVE